jgi:hypothetical protein
MPRYALITGLVLLMTGSSFAQYGQQPDPMQCQQIRQAAAQYGFAAARQHALATYGPEAVRMGDKCFATRTGSRSTHPRRASRSSSTKVHRANNPG